MIKNFEDTYKKFVDQLINFEKNKPCKEEVIIVGLDKGMKMDIYIFMQLCYNIVKQHKQDYISFKYFHNHLYLPFISVNLPEQDRSRMLPRHI